MEEKGGGAFFSWSCVCVLLSEDGRALEALDTLRADSELAGAPPKTPPAVGTP